MDKKSLDAQYSVLLELLQCLYLLVKSRVAIDRDTSSDQADYNYFKPL